MARGINKVLLIGNLGADPDNRYTPGGTAVANLSIATSEQWTDKQTGEKQERTEWHRVTLFGRTAEVAGEYLGKGSKVYIEGRLQTDKWQDKSGIDRYTTKIIANDMQMLSGRSSDQSGGPPPQGQRQPPPQQQQPQQQQPAAAGQGFDDDLDDDIPF